MQSEAGQKSVRVSVCGEREGPPQRDEVQGTFLALDKGDPPGMCVDSYYREPPS